MYSLHYHRLIRTTALAAALLAAPAWAQVPSSPVKVEAPAGTYVIDPTHASLTWKVNHLGLSNYTARFTRMDATLTFDPAAPEKTVVKATVHLTSIETDYPNKEKKDFNKVLATDAKWFNAMKFPAITFASAKVEKTGDATAKLHGDLTFLGVTKPLVMDVTYNGSMKEHPFTKSGALGFSAVGSLKRSDFGMTNGAPYVGDEVSFAIEAEFMQEKEAKAQ